MNEILVGYEKMVIKQDKVVKGNLDVQLKKLRERVAQKSK